MALRPDTLVRSASRGALLAMIPIAASAAGCRRSEPAHVEPSTYAYEPYRSTVEPEEPQTGTPQPLRRENVRAFGDPIPAPAAEGDIPAAIVTEEVIAMPGAAAAEPERDLGAELVAAVEAAMPECASALAAGATAAVSVSAYVTSSGRISRAEALGGTDGSLLRCVRAKVEGASLAGPIAGAPREVRASLVLTGRAARDARPAAFVLPRGAQAPGVVLPAVVDRLPSGNVPPGTALPAVVDAVPSGNVPPGITLPAIAQ